MKKFSTLLIAAVMGSGLTLGVSEWMSEDAQVVNTTAQPIPVQKADYRSSSLAAPAFDFTDAAQKAMPTVVHIKSTQMAGPRAQGDERLEQIPEQFRDFFGPLLRGQGDVEPRPRVGSGSGVLINADGYIVTNNHVIANADELEVTLSDNRSYVGTVIGVDPQTDIAVIKIEERNLAYLPMANSDDVQVGEWVLAVGNPFNLNSTATAGIISAKGRSINILTDTLAVESFLQTDAAVNPGNSGGALVNLDGNLIGINTAIASPTGAFAGYSFAVPSNIVSRVIDDLMTYGTVQRGLLGVSITNVTPELARERDLEVSRGAYVSGFGENSAARQAGIQEGDVITEIDNRVIRSSADLIGLVGTKRPGDVVNVTVSRDGKTRTFDVTLRNREGTLEVIKEERKEYLSVLGAELEEVDKETLNKLNIRNGVKVRRLLPGKIRQNTDIRPGFIITKIDGKSVSSPKDVADILNNRTGGILIEGVYEGVDRPFYYGLGL